MSVERFEYSLRMFILTEVLASKVLDPNAQIGDVRTFTARIVDLYRAAHADDSARKEQVCPPS